MLTTAFVAAVRRQGQFTADLTDADILAAADIEVQGRLIPLVRLVRQEYLVAEAVVTSYGGRLALPPRSIAGTVRQVQLLSGNAALTLPLMSLESDSGSPSSGQPFGWYFDGASVVLLPRGTEGTCRVRYYLRPSSMQLNTNTTFFQQVTVAAQDGAGGYVLTTNPGVGISTVVDVVSGASSHAVVATDLTGSGSTTQLVPATNVTGPIAAFDYVALAGYTPFVPVPEELAAALIHQTAGTLLRALAFDAEASQQLLLAEKALDEGRKLLAPRSEGNPRRLVGGIRWSLGQGWGSGGWGGGW